MKTSIRLLALVAFLPGWLHAQGEFRPAANLVVSGIPAIPVSLVQDVKRYTEARGAGFAGWHPQKLEMLISTRFGNTNQIHQVVVPRGMRKQLTFFDEPVGSSGYDRVRGDFIVFSRDQGGSEFGQLYRYDVADGSLTLLTDGGRSQNGGTNWSSRGDRIAYGSTRRNGADRDIYVMDPRDPKSDQLVAQLKGGGWYVTDWSPDDKTLLVLEYVSVNESHLWLAEVATGKLSELTPRRESNVAYRAARFSSDGKGVYITSDRDFEFQRIAYLDLASRQPTYLTSDIKHDVDQISLSEDGKKLLFITNDNGAGTVFLMDTATRRYRQIGGLPTAQIGGGSWHKDNRHVALVINSPKSPSDVFVLDVDSGSLTRWTESELGGLVSSQLNEAGLITWKSFDGLEVSGFMYKPAAKFSGRRPVVVNIHGGPEGQSNPSFLGSTNYYLNELGVALIYPNVRGSTGFGKTFVALDNGMLRENPVKDIGALLDWIKQQPNLDAERVMITGGSYGGYMTLACAVHFNDRIRCSVDVVGISNFVTFLQNTESYRRDLRRVEYGDERDPAMREFLQRISPLTNAAKIKKPLFIIQGANDPRVPRTEAAQMADMLRGSGTPVWYLEAKDEGHGFRKKANQDYQFYATIQFMREYLLK